MCVVCSWIVDSRYFHRKEFLMVEAAEEEVRQTEPGLVGWGRWSVLNVNALIGAFNQVEA